MPAGPKREDDFVARQCFHIGHLVGRTRHQRFLAGADHDAGGIGFLADDAFERRFGGHRDDRLHRFLIDILAA